MHCTWNLTDFILGVQFDAVGNNSKLELQPHVHRKNDVGDQIQPKEDSKIIVEQVIPEGKSEWNDRDAAALAGQVTFPSFTRSYAKGWRAGPQGMGAWVPN